MDLKNLIVFPLIVTTILSYSLTPLVIRLAWKLGLVDDPTKHKHPKILHDKPTPRGGSLAIYLAILVSSLIFLPADPQLMGILIGATLLIVMGLLDDKFDLNPYIRLTVQFIAAAIPAIVGIGITFITNPAGGVFILSPLIASLITIFWIVFLMNGLNFGAKGVDGQLSGVVVIAATTIALLSLRFSADIAQWPVIVLALITAGGFLGFLPWHIYPQKIMPSFGGSNLAGYLLGILSILSTAKVGTLLVVLAIPLIDTGYVILRRLTSGRSPFWGDRGHLHHRLLDNMGLSKAKVAIFYWVATGVLGVLALNLNTSFKFYTIIGVAIFIGGLILWLTYKPKSIH